MNKYVVNIVDRMQNVSYMIDDGRVNENTDYDGCYCDDNILILMDGYIMLDGRRVRINEIVDAVLCSNNIGDFVNKFNINTSGDFCLFVFFRKESKVLVFRDPMGHKVCYFCVDKEIVYFTNDSSYLYSLPIDKKADLNYIYKYLFYQTPGYMEYTSLPIQNCYRCLAGHYLLFELNPEGCISYKQKSYFNVNHIRVNYEATEEETMQFFKEAVYASFEDSSFLLSQGGAVAVSGGLDSTFICSVLQNMGLKSRVNYFSHSIWEDERGYSEDRYLDILESKFNIKVNRFCLYEKIPSLFREDAWGDILDGEPGSLSSIRNFNTIISKVFELNTNRVVFGYTESLYRNVGDSVVTYKEFLGLPNVLKLKYYQHYKQCCRNVTRPRLLSWAANNCCDNAINRNYDKSSVISSRLHDIYIASNSTPLFAKMGVHSIQEVKYENILSPNYECLANFKYALNGISSITPLHNTNLLKFAIATPSFQFYGDPKYYMKRTGDIPKEIISRPKVGSSTSYIFKSAIPFAAKFMNMSLNIEPCINMDSFRALCQRIISGTFSGLDFRRFFSIVSLEKFISNHSIKIDL